MRENLCMMSLASNYNSYLAKQVAGLIKNSERVLDFGCGIGTIAKLLKALRPNAHIICVDIDEELLREVPFEKHSSLAQIDKEVDVIYTINVLEHIEDDFSVLTEFYRLLKPKGMLYIYVPAFQVLYSKMDEEVGHVRRYGMDELELKVKRAGFRVLASQYDDPIGFLASLYLKLFKTSPSEKSVLTYDRWLFPLSKWLTPLTAKLVGKNISLFAQKT